MTPLDLGALFLLSSVWGASFLFMRIAAPVLGPLWLVEGRVLIAGIVLFVGCLLMGRVPELRSRWRQFLVIGLLNSALPFVLISTAELHLTASLAATLNATTPLFGALVTAWWLKDTLTLRKVGGLLLGFAGVALLVGLGPLPLSWGLLGSVGASLVAAVCYAFSAAYTKVKLQGASPMAIATYSQLFAAVGLWPALPFDRGFHAVTMPALACTLALALLSTALGYLLYFRLIERVGPTRATMVTYLSPGFGLVWGALFLSEPIRPSGLAGFALILASVALVSGMTFRRAALAVEPA